MNQVAEVPFGSNGLKSSRSLGAERWGALLGAGALAVVGITRKSRLGLAMAASGGALAYAVLRSNSHAQEHVARASILLNCSPEEAFRYWRDFENLPRFMRHLESVAVTDNRRSQWVALGPMGRRFSWNAEITDERPNEFISWHSLPDSDLAIEGFVDFRKAPANRGTILTATIRYQAPGGALGKGLSKMLGKDPSFLVRQDLRRLKALLEAGEIPTIEGQSHGPRDIMTGVARVINPDQPIGRNTNLAEAVGAARRSS